MGQGAIRVARSKSANLRSPKSETESMLRAAWGRSSAGRASRSQCEGREFDPPRLHRAPLWGACKGGGRPPTRILSCKCRVDGRRVSPNHQVLTVPIPQGAGIRGAHPTTPGGKSADDEEPMTQPNAKELIVVEPAIAIVEPVLASGPVLPGKRASENTERGRSHGLPFIFWVMEQKLLTLLAVPTLIATLVM